MTRRHTLLPVRAAAALALATTAFAALAGASASVAAPADNVGVQTARDLMNLCDDPSDTARIACKFFVLGALQSAGVMHASDTHDPKALLYCASDSTTNGDLVRAIRGLVAAHPERLDYPAASVVVGGAMEAYPCARAPATLHHSPVKRAAKHD